MKDYKQAIILNQDIEISVGKMISQACHASVKSFMKADDSLTKSWMASGGKKIALKSSNLGDLESEALKSGIPCSLIEDAGLTEIEPGTVTAVGIGPAEASRVDRVTGDLELIQ